jgi:hypothetical protein
MQNQFSKPRRSFLSRTVAASFGAAVLGVRPARGQLVEESTCDRFFLVDHLTECGRIVDSALSAFLSKALLTFSITLDQCIALHHKLECLIVCLESELANSTTDIELRQIKDLCQTCRKSAEYLRSVNATDHDVRELATGISKLSKQVCERARKLLPDEDVKLTKKAAGILRDIICLIDNEEFVKFNKELTGYSSYSEQAKNILEQFDEVRIRLRDARSYVVDLENPCFNGNLELSRLNAETQVGKALYILKNLILPILSQPATPTITQSRQPISVLKIEFVNTLPDVTTETTNFDKDKVFSVKPGPNSVLPAFDTLVLTLVWIKKAIRTISPPPLTDPKQCDPTLTRNEGREQESTIPEYVNVGAKNVPAPDRLAESIRLLLSRTCPPGSNEQVNQCKKIVESVRKLSWLLAEDSSKALIRQGLNLSEYIRSMPVLSCPNAFERERLVIGLFLRL